MVAKILSIFKICNFLVALLKKKQKKPIIIDRLSFKN